MVLFVEVAVDGDCTKIHNCNSSPYNWIEHSSILNRHPMLQSTLHILKFEKLLHNDHKRNSLVLYAYHFDVLIKISLQFLHANLVKLLKDYIN